jgi:3-dehydroquinate synthase
MSEEIEIHSKLREYRVRFVDDAFAILKEETKAKSFLVIDSVVYGLYRARFDTILNTESSLIVVASETHKSYDHCSKIIQQLLDKGVRRNTRLVAVGGGVIQDIVAFCSSILMRGLEWSFIPTTLLAQADSCIGGKTSINFGEVKNTIGNFYPPSIIYIDTAFLMTLSTEDIKSGIGEMLHFYYYSNSSLTNAMFSSYPKLLVDRSILKPFILQSLSIKKSVIEIDEFDKGERNKFNYGHTFGHALESVTNYAIKHGQAVTVGMDIANMYSSILGLMDSETYRDIASKLKLNFPDYALSDIDTETYVMFLSKDKKNIDDQLVCILSEGPGKLVKKKIPMNREFRDFLANYFRTH